MWLIRFPCNGPEVNEYFLEREEEGDGKWLTLPPTKEGGDVAGSSLGPFKYVLWVGGSVNRVELGSRDPGQGGVYILQPMGAQQRGLWESQSGKPL